MVHLEALARIHHFLDVALQPPAGAQGEQLVDDGQGVARHDGRAQRHHVVVVKIQILLHLRPVVGLLQPEAVALPVVVLEGLLHGQGDLLGVLGHGGVEDQSPAFGFGVGERFQRGLVVAAVPEHHHGAGERFPANGDLLPGGAGLGLEDNAVAFGVNVLQQLAAAVGRDQFTLIAPGDLPDDHFGLPLAAGGVHQIRVSTGKIHSVTSLILFHRRAGAALRTFFIRGPGRRPSE